MNDQIRRIEKALDRFLPETDALYKTVTDAMRYSLLNGGKRVRAVLALEFCKLCGGTEEEAMPFACAVEMVHAYSLIHDDLPEMDNDDFRRGRPSNHKVFGVGNALLAGDGLLNTAYAVLFEKCKEDKLYVDAAAFICGCAGVHGMIAGQSADLMCAEKGIKDEEMLDFIVSNKTGKLISAAAASPAVIAGGKYFLELRQFGEDLGKLFQLTDDVLDEEGSLATLGKSAGKDRSENKLTYVTFYGIDQCRVYADIICSKCLGILEGIEGETAFLGDLVNHVRYREG